MKRGKKLIGLGIAVVLGLSLILVPVASRVSPVQAAVTWRYPVEVTLDSEKYVVDAWVIKESATSYKMWYTHAKKDMSITDLISDIADLNLDNLVSDIADLDLAQFLNELDDLTEDVGDIVGLLDGISTVIGYATSTNGRTWTVQDSPVLVGSSSAAWDSVGTPCVIWDATDSKYKMWYTRVKTVLTQTVLEDILDDIASTNTTTRKNAILDLLDSTSTVIGYATWDGVSDNWTMENSQVLPVTSIDVWSSVADPCVIWDATDSKYKMWYTHPKTDLNQEALGDILDDIGNFGIDNLLAILDGTSTVIGYATSSDGVTWTVPDSQVLPETSGGAWNSVADPSVIRNSDTDYEMWYTNVKTNLFEANLHTLAGEIEGLDITALWTTLKDEGIAEFIIDLLALDIDDIKGVLGSTSTVIGYATWDGVSANWTVQNSQHLVGSSGSPWSSVAAPSVVKSGSSYEMWYTQGIADLTWQNLLDLVLGDNLPIGYAYYTVPRVRVVRRVVVLPGVTDVSDVVTSEGIFTEDVTAESFDGLAYLTIDEGTIGLIEGEPLSEISMVEMEEPPAPPEDSNIIGLVYDFGPDGATFSPPIIIEFTVDPTTLPPGVAVEDLVIAYYDETLVPPAWVELPTTFDPATNTLMADVSHFTAFAVITAPPPPALAPAAFTSSSLSISPLEVDTGQTVTISISVANTGGKSGSYTVVLKIDGVKEAEERVTVAAGSSQKVTFTTSKDVAGTYSVDVSGLTGSFAVKEEVVPPVAPLVPATFAISNLFISPTEVDIGEEVTISVLIANTGELTGSYEVKLKIDNVAVAAKEVVLAGGASQEVTFTTSNDVAGTYSVDVSGLTGSFTVKEEVIPVVVPPVAPKPIAWWVWLIIGLVAAAVVGSAVWMVVRRRRA